MKMDVLIFGDPDDEIREGLYSDEIGKCPLCHVGIHSDNMSSILYKNVLYTIHHCPSCDGVFFCSYEENSKKLYKLHSVLPQQFVADELPESIKNLSPDFSRIFSQAQKAEENKLTEICGLGYRRALEFLVKDYLCNLYPDHADEIKQQPLGQCIKEGIEDKRIKVLAERATWIGNDQTHYIRKHEHLDIQDMKRFIRAMVAFIDAESAFKEALEVEPKK